MIQLRPDCLIIKTTDGDQIPCSATWMTLELLGDAAVGVEPEMVEDVAAAVLHYFKHDQSRDFVSVEEFARALEKVLRGLGLSLGSKAPPPEPAEEKRVVQMDLRQIASRAGDGCELFFFPSLREELKRQLESSPQVVRFSGLRPCVKHLAGANRWNRRCQTLNDQIVDYLRTCWHSENASQTCSLVVS